jgi:hypothetical protein
MAWMRMGGLVHPFLTAAIDGSDLPTSRPRCLSPERKPVPVEQKLDGLEGRSNVSKNRKYGFSLYGFEPRIVQSIDYALYRRHYPGTEFDLC